MIIAIVHRHPQLIFARELEPAAGDEAVPVMPDRGHCDVAGACEEVFDARAGDHGDRREHHVHGAVGGVPDHLGGAAAGDGAGGGVWPVRLGVGERGEGLTLLGLHLRGPRC